jgi:hypothetical protein
MPDHPRRTSMTLRLLGVAFDIVLAAAGVGILLLAIDTGPRMWRAWSSWLGPATEVSGTLDNLKLVSTRPRMVDMLAPALSMIVYFLGLALFLERMGKVLGSRVGTGWHAAAGACAAAGLATIAWGVRVCARSRFIHTEDFTDLPLAGVWWLVVGSLAVAFALWIVHALLTFSAARSAGPPGPQPALAQPAHAPDPPAGPASEGP